MTGWEIFALAAIAFLVFGTSLALLVGEIAHARDAHQLDGFDDGATKRADRRDRLTAVDTEIERAATEFRQGGKW